MSSLRKKSLFLKVFLKLNNLEKYRFVSSKIKKISFESLEKIFSRLYISVSFDEKLCNCKRQVRPCKLVKSFLSVEKERKEEKKKLCKSVQMSTFKERNFYSWNFYFQDQRMILTFSLSRFQLNISWKINNGVSFRIEISC